MDDTTQYYALWGIAFVSGIIKGAHETRPDDDLANVHFYSLKKGTNNGKPPERSILEGAEPLSLFGISTAINYTIDRFVQHAYDPELLEAAIPTPTTILPYVIGTVLGKMSKIMYFNRGKK